MCIETWKMYNKSPKCDVCMPEIMEENQEVLKLYLLVQHQHIMGSSGPIDLNFQSVKIMMDWMGIKNQKEMFDKVYNLYKKMLGIHYKRVQHERAIKQAASRRRVHR